MVQKFNPYKELDPQDKEHELMLSNLRILITRPEGREFIKYILKNFGFGEVPPMNLAEALTRDMMGFNRAGEAFFNIAAQADPIQTGLILAEIQKEKYSVQNETSSTGRT